jgi:GNAT superfamily N-acetyltransferase
MNSRTSNGTALDANAISLRHVIETGDLGRIVALHGVEYDKIEGFGIKFEAYVAKTVAEYVLNNQSRGRIWLAENGGRLVGCAAIAERDGNAGQLRWVLVDSECRGTGLGGRLVEAAIGYCRERGFDRVFLETTTGLHESMGLYEKLGFHVESEELAELWDGPGDLITMTMSLT